MHMNHIEYIDKNIWWIILENSHYGIVTEGAIASSIHNFMTFDNEADWKNKLLELNIPYEDPSNEEGEIIV